MSPEARARFRQAREVEPEARLRWSVETFMFLASGSADTLSGRHFSWADSPNELRRRRDEIVEKDEYIIRRDPPLPSRDQRRAGEA